MLVGDPRVFAIESSITRPYASPGQRALGFFLLHVGGKSYGVREPEATLLACSFDAVARRLARRGKHEANFGLEASATKIADAVLGAMYDDDRQGETYFGMSANDLRANLASSGAVWAPDGDAAFDDGGHVLHFDRVNQVRLIAFKNVPAQNRSFDPDTLREIWMDADRFYGVLGQWHRSFESEWATALKRA